MSTKPSARGLKSCKEPECLRMKALFSAWHDGSLHWRTRTTLEEHLVVCPPCSVFFRSMEETIVLVREWPGVEVPVGVRGHLREMLRERHERSPKGRVAGCGGARPGGRAGGRAGGRGGEPKASSKKR